MSRIFQIIFCAVFTVASSLAFAAVRDCRPVEVRKAEKQFRTLEFTLGEAEVDFKRIDPDYRKQLNDSISRSLENLRQSKNTKASINAKAEELRAALEDFNRRPDEELDSTVTQVFADFAKMFSQNPEVDIELANSTLKAQTVLKRQQSAWLHKFQVKNKLFSSYVKAMNEFQDLQKTCRVGRYQD
jgi:hypothetical protein